MVSEETDEEAGLRGIFGSLFFIWINNLMANTTSCPTPDNITPLSPNGFMFTVTKLPDVSFFCQQVNLPGITLGEPEFANPFTTQPIPGDHLTYDQLTINFLIDSEMKNYKVLYNWIIALGFPQGYDQYKAYIQADVNNYSELAKNFSDATLSILTGNNNIAQQVAFVDLFPTTIDTVTFQSTNTDVNYISCNATFRYGYYKFL